MSSGQLDDIQRKRWTKFMGVGGLCMVLGIVAGYSNPAAFFPAFWLATIWMIATSVGGQLFVLGQQGLGARSAVVARRPMEWIALGTGYAIIFWLFLYYKPELTLRWWHEASLPDWRGHVFRKLPYFGRTFLLSFFILSAGAFFARSSREQDTKPDPDKAARLRRGAWPLLVFTLVLTAVAAADWILGLDVEHLELSLVPVVLAVFVTTGLAAALAVVAVFTSAIARTAAVPEVADPANRARIGRWLAISIVVAAAAVVALALAGGPAWRAHWTDSAWMPVTIAAASLAVLGAVLAAARRLAVGGALALLATLLVFYQLVMPLFSATILPSWTVIGGLTAALPIVLFPVTLNATRYAVYPINDPLLTK